MHRRVALLALSALTVTGCASSDAAPPEPGTVAVGSLPGVIGTTEPSTTTTTPSTDPATMPSDETLVSIAGVGEVPPIGRQVTGNRVIVIGDSVLASISNSY